MSTWVVNPEGGGVHQHHLNQFCALCETTPEPNEGYYQEETMSGTPFFTPDVAISLANIITEPNLPPEIAAGIFAFLVGQWGNVQAPDFGDLNDEEEAASEALYTWYIQTRADMLSKHGGFQGSPTGPK